MEFWIYIVIASVAMSVICLVAFFLRCSGYQQVMKKMRTLSMASHDSDAEAASAHEGQDRSVVVPAPPPYSVCLQHPIIARSTADLVRSDVERPQGEENSNDVMSPYTDDNFQSGRGDALPMENFFEPPPYCLEPPAYYDVIEDAPQYDATMATRGSAVVY
jgi:hypothetical protein